MADDICDFCKGEIKSDQVITDCWTCGKCFHGNVGISRCFDGHIKSTGCKGGHTTILTPMCTIKIREVKDDHGL